MEKPQQVAPPSKSYFNHDTEKESGLALLSIKSSEERLQRKIISHLRMELSKKLDTLKMKDERKSYFLHQIANTFEIEELISLVNEINKKQLLEMQDLIILEKTLQGISWNVLSHPANNTTFH